MWDWYLASAEAAFRHEDAVVFQVLLTRRNDVVPPTRDYIARAERRLRRREAKLAAIEPRGKSSHLVALRLALDLRPDVVVWLTDADELTAAVLKPVLKSSARSVPVCVGLVTPEGVQQPRELK